MLLSHGCRHIVPERGHRLEMDARARCAQQLHAELCALECHLLRKEGLEWSTRSMMLLVLGDKV